MILSINNFRMIEDDNQKRDFYQKANEEQMVDLVRQLNDLGMKPETPPLLGPTIVSNFMDIATKYDTILAFLKNLRETNRLLTKKEFKSLSTKKWVKKSLLSRILGCDYINQKITDLQLKHIKPLKKIAVLKEKDSVTIKGYAYDANLYDLDSDQFTIYAEEKTSVNRKLSKDEIDELIQIIAATNFVDMWPANIMVAEDGLYFIDTEFKSFSGDIEWNKMGRFISLINDHDKEYFCKKIQEKMDAPNTMPDNDTYRSSKRLIEQIKKKPSSELSEEEKIHLKNLVNNVSSLELVGIKKAGREYYDPNIFSFSMKEICNL